ncbi:MAG: EAL domain-containing protein [Lachnospiraceae bacterium]|nr:EAL domain-containing protein [Lachnospiraceae bacterium]
MDDLRYQVDLLTAMNQKISADESMYRALCEQSNRAFIYIQPQLNVVKTLGRWDEFFGFRPNELSDLRSLMSVIDDDYKEVAGRAFFPERDGKKESLIEIPIYNKKQWVEIHTSVSLNSDDTAAVKIIAFRDITKMHDYKEELTYMAYYDSLTGLYNRNYFITKLGDFITKAEKENAVVSVLLVDIDEFHKINDGMGILTGDEVVQNLGLFIKGFLGDNVIGSRFDGDFFALAIYEPIGNRSVDYIYDTLMEYLKKPMVLTDNNEVLLSVTCGVAEYPEASDNPLQLVNCAEIVLFKAKDTERGTLRFYDKSLMNEFINNVNIERKLKDAVRNMDFSLNFQPQYFADSKRLRGVETLIRWNSEGQFISPAVFIPIAEKNGSIVAIGDWVLEQAIKAHMEWKAKFDFDMILSINISAIQYRRQDFVSKVIGVLKKYEMPASELEIEITESVLIEDFNSVTAKMEELRDYGVKVSIDDFGTGYSSLSYLKKLPVDTLKIDKSFIDSLVDDESSKIITETIIYLSKKLGYEIVAEGVETNEQFEALKDMSCDLIQGYFLGKPMTYDAIEDLLLRLI